MFIKFKVRERAVLNKLLSNEWQIENDEYEATPARAILLLWIVMPSNFVNHYVMRQISRTPP